MPDISTEENIYDGNEFPRTYVETDSGALRRNYRALTSLCCGDGCEPVAVVKAGAYGHGPDICVPVLLEEGCRMFAVATVHEALEVRGLCDNFGTDAGILILGRSDPRLAPLIAERRIDQACMSYGYARELSDALRGGTLGIHIAVDTGMNRIGFPAFCPEDVRRSAGEIVSLGALPGLRIDGMFSHFARADDRTPEADARTRLQGERFVMLSDALASAGTDPGIRHICNSAASVRFPEYRFDACRFGILLYGLAPSRDVTLPLEPVLALRARVSQVHRLRKGEEVGYGGTFTAVRDSELATLPVGYADGFLRAYSGAEIVLRSPSGGLKGRGRIVGRICMDMCMADVTGLGAAEGDIATLIGEPGQLDALASLASTINYECVSLLSSRLPRIRKDRTD